MRIKAHTQGQGGRGTCSHVRVNTLIYVGGRCSKKQRERERDGDCQSQAIQLAQRIAAAALYVRACVCVLTKETRLSLVMLLITSATLAPTEIQLDQR